MIKRKVLTRRRFMKYGWLGLVGLAGIGSLIAALKPEEKPVPTGTPAASTQTPPLTARVKEGLAPTSKVKLNQAPTNAATAVPPTSPAKSANSIVVENSLPGTGDWLIINSGDDNLLQIKGYASATSVNKGESISFHVTVNPPQAFTMEIYRIGWYNGTGGRLLKNLGSFKGSTYKVPDPDNFGTIDCNWPAAATLVIPPDWTSGVYLVKLTNAESWQNYIHFVVRDDNTGHDLLMQNSVTTYQAYNIFGGRSLYEADKPDAVPAVKISFDRPYSDTGMGQFFFYEMPFVRFIEQKGYDVSYCSDLDLHTNPGLMDKHKAFLSVGHDEYWSAQMYDHALAFRNMGKHLGFFGANAIYWQVRFENSSNNISDRVMVCYKSRFKEDPLYPGPTTTYLWRELPATANQGFSRPENSLIGVMFDSWSNNNPGQTYVVENSNHWVYAGTGLTNGTHIPGLVGYEWDKRYANGLEPPGLVELSNSPVVDDNGLKSSSQATIYQADSGAWVFATGSIYWSFGLDFCGFQVHDQRNPGIQRATVNVLDRFTGSTTL